MKTNLARVAALGASLVALAACAPASAPSQSSQSADSTASADASGQGQGSTLAASLKLSSTGYAEAAEGLKVYYEIHGQGDPIVVMAGGLGDISSMAQVIGPLAQERQVIGIDLEGHGRTALRETPMSHERLGDDVAAVLKHLNIAKADVAGYSHGGDAAIRMTIQHPEMVRNLLVISTAAERDGWYPEVLKGMEAVGSAQAEQMKQTPLYTRYAEVAPKPEQYPVLLDRMGELMRKTMTGAWRSSSSTFLPCCFSPTTTPSRRTTSPSSSRCSKAACAMRAGRANRNTPAPASPSCRATLTTISAWAQT